MLFRNEDYGRISSKNYLKIDVSDYMMKFDWHSGEITRATIIDSGYKNTQNVRRFLIEACGPHFKFDRRFMAWITDGTHKNMGDVIDTWLLRKKEQTD
jgi:hypothetical protein